MGYCECVEVGSCLARAKRCYVFIGLVRHGVIGCCLANCVWFMGQIGGWAVIGLSLFVRYFAILFECCWAAMLTMIFAMAVPFGQTTIVYAILAAVLGAVQDVILTAIDYAIDYVIDYVIDYAILAAVCFHVVVKLVAIMCVAVALQPAVTTYVVVALLVAVVVSTVLLVVQPMWL